MTRNMDRHHAEETKEGIGWSIWQAEQLKALEKYKKDNQKRYRKQFQDLNKEMDELIWISRQRGNVQQEIQILNAIRKGSPARKINKGATVEFFRLNDRKLEALIKATTNDTKRAETAVLRMTNDQYRKAIFNAQIYANSGAGTYEKAAGMATRDILSRGLNCVEYANGARHTLSDYADMAIRVASKRTYLQGEGEKRQEWGITTVIVNKRENPCPKCLPFVGKILIDDVWSGGKKSDGPYPLMSKAIAAGLYHPRCKDSHTTYLPGVSTADDTWTREKLDAVERVNQKETKRQYAERQAEKSRRLVAYSLDKGNQERYMAKREEWGTITKDTEPDIIKLVDVEEEIQAHPVGKIDKEVYKRITEGMVTDEIIITDERIGHIKERHPNDYEKYCEYLKLIVEEPDYIVKTEKPNTALILKEVKESNERQLKTVFRLTTSTDNPGFKNSIITFMEIDEKKWSRLLRNKLILYKKE